MFHIIMMLYIRAIYYYIIMIRARVVPYKECYEPKMSDMIWKDMIYEIYKSIYILYMKDIYYEIPYMEIWADTYGDYRLLPEDIVMKTLWYTHDIWKHLIILWAYMRHIREHIWRYAIHIHRALPTMSMFTPICLYTYIKRVAMMFIWRCYILEIYSSMIYIYIWYAPLYMNDLIMMLIPTLLSIILITDSIWYSDDKSI